MDVKWMKEINLLNAILFWEGKNARLSKYKSVYNHRFYPTLCSHFTFFHAVYHGKILEVLKTAREKQLFTPVLCSKYFPVVDHCWPAAHGVGTGISPSVL